MQFKELLKEAIPAVLAAMIAVLGSYIAVREDITKLAVNQEVMIEELREYRLEQRDLRGDVHKQDVRIARLEERR